jgi:sugar lactone lactonase YvrE
MSTVIKRVFRAPYSVPNGIHATADGLWVVDQITDRVASIAWGEPNEYGVTQFLRDISTESSNTSGLTYGDGSLWLAANGPGTLWRPARPTDAEKGKGEILRVDPVTGVTQGRWPVPDGGGVHGIEYDPYEPGRLWITTLHSQTLSKVRIADWEVELVLPLPYPRTRRHSRRRWHLGGLYQSPRDRQARSGRGQRTCAHRRAARPARATLPHTLGRQLLLL